MQNSNIVFDDILALDANNINNAISNRKKYHDNFLRIDNCILSKAEVSKYWGREIPGYQQINLDGSKIYNVLREEHALQQSVSSFEGLPLLNKHIGVDSTNLAKDNIAGAVGTNLRYENESMKGTITIHDQASIDLLEHPDPEKRVIGISCGYKYIPVVESGIYKGQSYDIKMTNIVGNHIALVNKPRVSTAVVADNDSINVEKGGNMFNNLVNYLFGAAEDKKMEKSDLMKAIRDVHTSDKSDSEKNGMMSKLLDDFYEGDRKRKTVRDEDTVPMKNKKSDNKSDDDYDEDEDDKKNKPKKKQKNKNVDDEDSIFDADSLKSYINCSIKEAMSDIKNQITASVDSKKVAMDEALNLYRTMYGEPNAVAFDNSPEKVYEAIIANKGMSFDGKTFEQKAERAKTLAETHTHSYTSNVQNINNDADSIYNDEAVKKFLGGNK